MNVAMRLTFLSKDLLVLFGKIGSFAHSFAVFDHMDGARPHCHALIMGLSITIPTLKNWIVKELGFRPTKTDWSFKVGADVNFITYMSKGHIRPAIVKGFDDMTIQEYTALWVDHKNQKKDKETITTWDMAVQLAQFMDSEAKQVCVYRDAFTQRHEWYDVEPKVMIRKAIDIHVQNKKSFTDFSIMRVIQTAMGISSRDKWKEQIVNQVYVKLFPV